MFRRTNALALAVLIALVALPTAAHAHCDAMEGPVVTDARAALKAGDVTPVLKWVAPRHETEIRAAFQKTLKVRTGSDTAREVADLYFFNTLVRLHRDGENAPFTGLKPGHGNPDPSVVAADRALEKGSADALVKQVTAAVEEGIRHRFRASREAWKHADESVAKGREAVHAYVEFIHYVKDVHQTATGTGGHGDGEGEAAHGASREHAVR